MVGSEMFALVQDGSDRVFQVETEAFDVATPFRWVKCSESADTSYVFAAGKVVPAPLPSVEETRRTAARMIDMMAETSRLRYITPGAGQAMTYQAKTAEVQRYAADTNPRKENYPFLSAEIGITGNSLTAVVDVVRAALDQWTLVGGDIERLRLKGKEDVSKAVSLDACNAIVYGIQWP